MWFGESTQEKDFNTNNSEPIIEEPSSPTQEEHPETLQNDVEDYDPYTAEIPCDQNIQYHFPKFLNVISVLDWLAAR